MKPCHSIVEAFAGEQLLAFAYFKSENYDFSVRMDDATSFNPSAILSPSI